MREIFSQGAFSSFRIQDSHYRSVVNQSAELIGQALFTPLALRSEGLASATLARCANVSSAFMPTAPARLLASLQVLHCFACSTSAADTHRLARPSAHMAHAPRHSFRKSL